MAHTFKNIALSTFLITSPLAIGALLSTDNINLTSPLSTPPNTAPSATPSVIKSIRLDLSSLKEPRDFDRLIDKILSRAQRSSVNTVYISPWSDGLANYQSNLAELNGFGQYSFVESFIEQAHANNIKVFAWFVVGKDNFPANAHPEWFAQTKNGQPLSHEDEPGLFLPMASLANQEYIDYHLKLIREVNQLPIDGWVISEPLMSWGDEYDDDYGDFSPSTLATFEQQQTINPQLTWADFRAQAVTDFVKNTINHIRSSSDKPVAITLFTEPDKAGNLVSFDQIKNWLGMDIPALASLNPDYLELQSLFLDFEYPQEPQWTASMIQQFRQQLNTDIPLLVSVQGFNSESKRLSSRDFSQAIVSATEENVAGISTYAYHTLRSSHWSKLRRLWK